MPPSASIPLPAAKALFLDRDGVINEDTGYPSRPSDIVFRPGIFEFCRAASAKGYLLVVVTNQSGVARGYFTEEQLRTLHAWMAGRFQEEGAAIAGFYYCPFLKDAAVLQYRRDSALRKPGPGMVLQAAKDLRLDIASSVMLGDSPSDRIELDGLRCIIIKSANAPRDYDVESLEQAQALI